MNCAGPRLSAFSPSTAFQSELAWTLTRWSTSCYADTRMRPKGASREVFMRILGALAAGLSVLLYPALAAAQDFPTKPIKLIVPFPAGGPNDIIARVVGQRMSELMKQPVLIHNRGGQGGLLGTDAVVKAKPDGYTIAISSAGALAISPSMQIIAYDTLKDLAPVTLVATVPEMLVVATNVPAGNMEELVELAKIRRAHV